VSAFLQKQHIIYILPNICEHNAFVNVLIVACCNIADGLGDTGSWPPIHFKNESKSTSGAAATDLDLAVSECARFPNP
jgi:hypothetical protein